MSKIKVIQIPIEIRKQVELLSDEEAGQLFKAVLAYSDDGSQASTDSRATAIVFAGIKAQIDAASDKYASRCAKNKATAIQREQAKKGDHNCAQSCTNVHNRAQSCTIVQTDKPKPDVDVKAFVKYFNDKVAEHHSTIGIVKTITEQRKGSILSRARENGKDALKIVVDKAVASDFLNGKNKKSWQATFDWLMRPTNFVKVLEGNYDNRKIAEQGGSINELWQ